MAMIEQELMDAKWHLAKVEKKLQRLNQLRSGEEEPKWDREREELEDEWGKLKTRQDNWEVTVQELQRKLLLAAQPGNNFVTWVLGT